jgi:hypothetical protein
VPDMSKMTIPEGYALPNTEIVDKLYDVSHINGVRQNNIYVEMV